MTEDECNEMCNDLYEKLSFLLVTYRDVIAPEGYFTFPDGDTYFIDELSEYKQ